MLFMRKEENPLNFLNKLFKLANFLFLVFFVGGVIILGEWEG